MSYIGEMMRSPVTSAAEFARRLADHGAELSAMGVASLAVFGSAARGEMRAGSDLDLVVEFDSAATFDRYMDLRFFLEDLSGRPVDLVTRRALKARLRPRVEREAIRVA